MRIKINTLYNERINKEQKRSKKLNKGWQREGKKQGGEIETTQKI
jgi:hypothetical protein